MLAEYVKDRHPLLSLGGPQPSHDAMEDSADEIGDHFGPLLEQRQHLTDALLTSPYDLVLFLQRAVVYSNLGYPDLASGDAYRALLLTDEVKNDDFEYHEQAIEALRPYAANSVPDVLRHGALSDGISDLTMVDGVDSATTILQEHLTHLASIRCFQILSLSLLLCGCLKSAFTFCERGLTVAPDNQELLHTRGYIETMARRRLRVSSFTVHDLPDNGIVRREVYPWNTHEPDRFSQQSLEYLNGQLASMAPKCAVQVSKLPILLENASDTDGYDIIPTCNQLGIFATQDIAPGEVVLQEYSLLTANNRHKESTCDACGTELPPLTPESKAVNCPECYDTVFCDDFCFQKAQELYHPAVCDKDVDSIAKDSDAKDADESLYLLLLARLLAMSTQQDIHPLEVNEIKYIWGDFLPSHSNNIDLSENAEPPPDWTLPFSFAYNIETPLHILEKMDVNIYRGLHQFDLWVFNTLFAKFRGTASARKGRRDGRPEVAAVHPFWCLANHDCDPNVTWEWGGRMTLWAREQRVVGGGPGGIRAGEEILNHYCDVKLPVQQRREWARGSLGGWCMCTRCRRESAAQPVNGEVR